MKKLILSIMLLSFFVSCQKKEQISKNLWANGGKWEIETVKTVFTTEDPDYNNETTTDNNVQATLEFNKDGFGVMSQTFQVFSEEIHLVIPFEYTNTEEVLILNFLDDDMEISTALGEVSYKIFDIKEWKRNNLTLYDKVIEFEGAYKEVTETTTTLKKVK